MDGQPEWRVCCTDHLCLAPGKLSDTLPLLSSGQLRANTGAEWEWAGPLDWGGGPSASRPPSPCRGSSRDQSSNRKWTEAGFAQFPQECGRARIIADTWGRCEHAEPLRAQGTQVGRQGQVVWVVRASRGPSKAPPPRSCRDDLLCRMSATLEGRHPCWEVLSETFSSHLAVESLFPNQQYLPLGQQQLCFGGGPGSDQAVCGYLLRQEWAPSNCLCQLVRLTLL